MILLWTMAAADFPLATQWLIASRLNAASNLRRSLTGVC